jgi:protoporphyrinogen oxidase
MYRPGHVLSSMPIRELIRVLHPPAPEYLRDVAECFHYRDFLTVAIVLRDTVAFPDNWIYIHDPSVQVGRIQNYKNWSEEMVPSPEYTCLGLEYFCFEDDALWAMTDDALVELGRAELNRLRLMKDGSFVSGSVVRVPKAYPVYDGTYQRGLDAVKRFLCDTPNLQLIGRNGMHHYNNQDHSMLTGILAARNIAGGHNDLWRVNADESYLEDNVVVSEGELDGLRGSQPRVPKRVDGLSAGAR